MPQGQPGLGREKPLTCYRRFVRTIAARRQSWPRTVFRRAAISLACLATRRQAGDVTPAPRFEPLAQALRRPFRSCTEIAEKRMARRPATLQRTQDDDRAAAVQRRAQTARLACPPRRGDEIQRFRTRHAQGNESIDWRIVLAADDAGKVHVTSGPGNSIHRASLPTPSSRFVKPCSPPTRAWLIQGE